MAENTAPAKSPVVKKFRMPDTYLIIVGLMIFAAILTYIIPAGVYEMVKDPNTGRKIIDPNSFHYVEQNGISLLNFLRMFSFGLAKQSKMILNVVLICGCFHVVNETKGLSNFFSAVINALHDKALLLIPIVMAMFGFLGTTGALVNSTIAFVPIGLVIAAQFKMDRVFAMAVIYLSTFAGFGSSFMSINSVQVAQAIAELPILSGSEFRIAVTSIIIAVTIVYTMIYCFRVRADRSKSVLWGTPQIDFDDLDINADFTVKLKWQDLVIVALTFGSSGWFVYGALNYKWGQETMAAFMVFSAVVGGKLAGFTFEEIAKHFVAGARKVLYGVILIGFAQGIALILAEGKVIHTIVHAVAVPLSKATGPWAAVLMFWFNLIFNFFVCSASGQAAIVMPIMTPLADAVGLSRQVAVLAYQYGDGLSNTIFPVSSSLVASLAIAGVPFDKWLKFQVPLFLIWTVIASVAISVAVMIGYC
ncbi:MAG: YfcC family protein [Pyramidobacter sp.]|nr:YfcC family protein [Pyramidobacter sp.]